MSQTEYIMVVHKDGELVDILSDITATGVMIQCQQLGYIKENGYEVPNFPELQASESPAG